MSFSFPSPLAAAGSPSSEGLNMDEGLVELMGPLLAGARARGVADACELLGVGAILIDGLGRVLHVGHRAERAFGSRVRVAEGHLVGADAGVNDALQHLISIGVGPQSSAEVPASVTIAGASDADAIHIRVLRFPEGQGKSQQLLKAILVISPAGAS